MESTSLSCQVCSRPPNGQRAFHCITCARSALYELRLEHAKALVNKEALGKEVERAVTAGLGLLNHAERKNSKAQKDEGPGNRIAVERAKAQAADAENSTQRLREDASTVRTETKRLREAVAERRRRLARRKATHDAATKAIGLVEEEAVLPLREHIRALETRWQKVQDHTAESRMLLCREAASLCSLQQKKRRNGQPSRDIYFMGGVPVVDLRELNSKFARPHACLAMLMYTADADPALVNTSLSYVAHLLHLTSHYLALRLPAELVLPSPSSPYPLIHTPVASHKAPTLPAGLRAAAASSSTSPPYPHQPSRDRVLHLDRHLHALAVEDPRAYGLFVDAAVLLAWDVAWLAHVQGVTVGGRTWEDVCNMGRTLFTLFVAPPPTPPPSEPRASPRPGIARMLSPTPTEEPRPTALSPKLKGSVPASKLAGLAPEAPGAVPAPGRGQLAHGTSHSFLQAAGPGGGADWMRTWRYASHVRVIDRVKAALANERTGAEWEVLEKDEWELEGTELPGTDENRTDTSTRARTQSTGRNSAGTADRESRGQSEETASTRAHEVQRPKKGWMRVRTPSGTETGTL